MSEKKGEIYCVCDQASSENCSVCHKGKAIKPDHTLNCPAWKKEEEAQNAQKTI